MAGKLTQNSYSSAIKNVAILHAEFRNWGEALHFARQCNGSDKVDALGQILRVHAEQQHPEFREFRIENISPEFREFRTENNNEE